jgi:hypothetical protein
LKLLFWPILIILFLPLKALALETIYLDKPDVKIQKCEIKYDQLRKLEYYKPEPCKIYHRDDFDIIILENTEIPINELATKKGMKKLIPALISTYISMNTLKLYNGQEDKVLHHTFNYAVTRICQKPIKTAASVSIIKEIGIDYLLGLGDPDINDAIANFMGAFQAKLTRSNGNSVNTISKKQNIAVTDKGS